MRAAQHRRISPRTSSIGLLAGRVAFAACVLLAGCGGGESSPTPPIDDDNLVASASTPTLTLAAGTQQTLTVAVTRPGTFTGPVSLTAGTLPTGVTVSFQPQIIPTGSTTSTVTVTAAVNATPGASALTITASGAGVTSASVPFQLTVTSPPVNTAQFTIVPSVSSFVPGAAGNGAQHQPTIAITRNAGYTGAITFSVIGLPATLAAGITPTNVTGSSTTLVIVNAGTPNGTYSGTIRAVGANGGGERTAPIQVVVMPPSTGSISWRVCNSSRHAMALFMAVKDGAGAWTRIVPGNAGTTYAFDLTQPTAQVAWVTTDSGVPRTTVYRATRQEITALAESDCTLYPDVTTRTANGQVTGMTPGQMSLVAMGGWSASTTNPLGGAVSSYALQNLPAGPLDLVAVRAAPDVTFTTNPDRAIIRRAVNPATGGSNALLDFGGADAFPLTSATWTVGNTSGEAFSVSQYFHTAGGTSGLMHPLPGNEREALARNVFGVPLDRTVAGDLHQTILTIGTTTPQTRRSTRQVIVYSRTISNRSIAFGPALPTPTVTSVSVAGAGLLRAQGTLPAEYEAGVTLEAKSTGAVPRFATVHATRAALGAGSTYDVAMPDLTGALGWDRNWNIRPGDATEWWVSGGGPALDFFDTRYIFPTVRRRWAGAATGITAPMDGSVFYTARAMGTIVP